MLLLYFLCSSCSWLNKQQPNSIHAKCREPCDAGLVQYDKDRALYTAKFPLHGRNRGDAGRVQQRENQETDGA